MALSSNNKVWPYPQHVTNGTVTLQLPDSTAFQWNVIGHNSDILSRAINRYKKIIFQIPPETKVTKIREM